MKSIKKISAAVALAILGLSTSANADQPAQPAISGINSLVVFGDSLSDNGTLTALVEGVNQFNQAQGLPTLPVPPQRFSDGNLWVDYLSESLNVPQFNYAISGARSIGHDSSSLQQAAQTGLFAAQTGYTGLGLQGQVENYLANFPGNKAEALHTILVGGNDIVGFLEGNSDLTHRQQVIERIVGVVSNSVYQLASAGAKNIVVLTLPEIGNLPRFEVSSRLHGRSDEANRIVELINRRLQGQLYKDRRFAGLEYNVTTVNGRRFFNNLAAGDQFVNPQQTWLQVVELDGQISFVPGADGRPQVNGFPSDFIFWDSIHPTTRAHQFLSDQVFDELQKQSHCFADVTSCSFSYELKLQ